VDYVVGPGWASGWVRGDRSVLAVRAVAQIHKPPGQAREE